MSLVLPTPGAAGAPKAIYELNDARITFFDDSVVFEDRLEGSCEVTYSELFRMVFRHGDWSKDY